MIQPIFIEGLLYTEYHGKYLSVKVFIHGCWSPGTRCVVITKVEVCPLSGEWDLQDSEERPEMRLEG